MHSLERFKVPARACYFCAKGFDTRIVMNACRMNTCSGKLLGVSKV